MARGNFVHGRRSILGFVGVSLLAGSLAGCGFSPVYGGGGSTAGAETDLAAIELTTFADREGQILKNFLLDRFNSGQRPIKRDYSLSGIITISSANLGTQLDSSTTRSQVTVVVQTTLSGFGETKVFSSTGVASYATSDTDYASEVARSAAVERALRVIADDVRLQIATYFEKRRRLNG